MSDIVNIRRCFKWVQGANEKYFYLDFTQPGYTCTNLNMQYEGMTWVLQTAVFHSPSEHTLGGGYFDAEVQFRHVSTTNQHVSVVSIFLQADPGKLQSTNNTFLNRLWRGRGMTALMKTTGINITSSAQDLDPYMDFFPASQSHYQYVGSSTEPPCTTDWDWFVFEKPVSISMSDLQLIRALPRAFKGNYLSPVSDHKYNIV